MCAWRWPWARISAWKSLSILTGCASSPEERWPRCGKGAGREVEPSAGGRRRCGYPEGCAHEPQDPRRGRGGRGGQRYRVPRAPLKLYAGCDPARRDDAPRGRLRDLPPPERKPGHARDSGGFPHRARAEGGSRTRHETRRGRVRDQALRSHDPARPDRRSRCRAFRPKRREGSGLGPMTGERHILDSLGSGLLVLDARERVALLNRTLAEMLHVSADDCLGRSAADLAALMAQFAMPAGIPRFDWPADFGSREIEWREGETLRFFREDSTALVGAGGAPAGRLFAYHDVSHEKAVDRMKSEFISVASHELRTPMTSIKGSVDLILSGFAGETSPEMQELLEIAQKSCDRLVRLVNDILDLSKIEAGQLKLNVERLDLTEIAVRAVCAVKSLADKTEVRLRVDRPLPLPHVEADPDRIEQAITNLLSNAVKFSPPKGEVIVELSAD